MLKHSPLAYPSLENLSHILRNRDLWPVGFEWNFKHCDQCALGIIDRLWHDKYPQSSALMLSEIPSETESVIFYSSRSKPKVRVFGIFKRDRYHEEVTPEMVADQIDEYLKRKEENISHVRTKYSREVELARVPA